MAELGQRMSSAEFTEWVAFYKVRNALHEGTEETSLEDRLKQALGILPKASA